MAKVKVIIKKLFISLGAKWDASSCSRRAFMRYLKNSSYLANMDRSYSFLIFKEEDKDLIGGVNVFNVRRGVSQSASLGYWIGKRFAKKAL